MSKNCFRGIFHTNLQPTQVKRMSDENEVNENEAEEMTEVTEIVAPPRDELQDAFEGWMEDEASDDDIIEMLHNDHKLSYPAAVNKLRVLKKAAGLTKPRGAKSEDVRVFIQECHDAGDERAVIITKLVAKYNYTKKSAASTFSVQGGKLGLTGGEFGARAKRPLTEVVAWVRDHSDLKRSDFVVAMQADLEYTESTAGAFFTYLGFAKEYARQEVAAAE